MSFKNNNSFEELKTKTLKKSISMTYLIIGGCIIYGIALTSAGADYREYAPREVKAEEVALTVKTESPTTKGIISTVDRASHLNEWIASKEPNSPLNNTNINTGKVLIEIEEATKVKAEFILAKAYQETKLGTTGVCSRNVGSVGETDRDRRLGVFCQDFRNGDQKKNIKLMEHYQTDDYVYKSLRAIADTMNNQYLGNSTVLCQLSKGYKGCSKEQISIMKGKYYASNAHHSEAMASILTEITGEIVDLQYNFKIK